MHYRAYTIGPDGHFVDFLNIEAVDDHAALQVARRSLDDRNVEVWQQARPVGRLELKPDLSNGHELNSL